jgi:MFS family permease
MSADEDKIEKSLRVSMFDGVFASVMAGFTQEYFAPFVILLNATVRQIGILTAVPNLVAAVLQIKSAELTERLGSRKRVLNIFVLLQALMLIPMTVTAVNRGGDVYLFIAMVTLFTASGAFATPAWGSMMSDLVSEGRRGDYFGWRTMLLGIVTIAAMFIAGLLVQYSKVFSVYFGFALLFFLAFVCRMFSWSFLNKMYDPPLRRVEQKGYSFLKFLSKIRGDNFARFVVSVSLMNFSVNLAGPFFAVLMLRELHFSYLLYTVIMVAASLSVYLTIRRWGAHADRVGNIKIIKATSFLISIIPLWWLVSLNPVFLIFAQIYSGFCWSGFNLAAANFIYDAVPSHDRVRSIAYFNVINGVALFSGAMLGGYLLHLLPPLFGYRILTLFLISAILRFGVSFMMLSKVEEVRPVTRIRSSQLFFSIMGLRPLLGVERKTLRY